MSKGGAPSEQAKLDALLSKARVLEQVQPRTIRQETILFQGCNLGFFIVPDEKNRVQGYQFVIQDPQEGKTYVFQFGAEVLNDLNVWVNGVQNVGEPIPTENVENNAS